MYFYFIVPSASTYLLTCLTRPRTVTRGCHATAHHPPPTGRGSAAKQPHSSVAVGPGRHSSTVHSAHVASVSSSTLSASVTLAPHGRPVTQHAHVHAAHIQDGAHTHSRTYGVSSTDRTAHTHAHSTNSTHTRAQRYKDVSRNLQLISDLTRSHFSPSTYVLPSETELQLTLSPTPRYAHRHVNMTAVTIGSVNNNNENPCNIFLVRRRTSYHYRFRHN
ncbi:hypothetical protein ACI65C_001191 [Semiaphis heraclei]